MADAAKELAEVQMELIVVKKALQTGGDHLGMRGEPLQQYFLQLNDKEYIWLSRQVQQLGVTAGGRGPALQPPPGPAKQFNKEELASVLEHLCEYEGTPQECAKAARALSGLAYTDAKGVGSNDRVVQQVTRLLNLHPTEEVLQTMLMRALCNMAYDPKVCAEKLATQEVLSALLAAASRGVPAVGDAAQAKPSEASSKASEALARIVAAEAEPVAGGNGKPSNTGSNLAKVFSAAFAGDASWHSAVLKLVSQLVTNEVIDVSFIAERFVAQTSLESPQAALGWMSLAKACAQVEALPELPAALVEAGACRAAVQAMQRYHSEVSVALAGVEAMSVLVGSRISGLQAFIDAGGVQRIETGMETHPDHMLLQTKSIRALASGVLWSQDMQRKGGYSTKRGVALTKAAMVRHGSNEDLQVAALEALARYIERADCKAEVAEGGGEGLAKAMMTRHNGSEKVQRYGRAVLDGLGVDKSWKPMGAQANGTGAGHPA